MILLLLVVRKGNRKELHDEIYGYKWMKRTERRTGKSTDCPADSEVLVSLASLVGTYGLVQPRDSVLRDYEDRIEEERPTCHLHKGQKVGDSMSSMCECLCVCV